MATPTKTRKVAVAEEVASRLGLSAGDFADATAALGLTPARLHPPAE